MAETPGERWDRYFGFEQPYANQRDAIEAAIEVGSERGYLAMEGPCGTGKTMAALTAGAALVRDGDYENVVVVTPVKQQRTQFVEDLRAMNAGLDEPLTGVALVGKRDLCPYGREGVFPDDVGVHDRCEDLRENTAGLVESEGTGDDMAATTAAVGGETEDVWWDPQRASDLVKHARPGGTGQRQITIDTLETAGAETPYPRTQQSAPESMSDGEEGPLYCPFEADWYARNKGSPVGFEAGENHVVTATEYLPAAAERGTCPHRAMGVLLESAEVIVGNYNHLFDPGSRPLLESVLGEETFLVVDEAHRLEERVRDLLSNRVGRQTLKRARNDFAQLLTRARQSGDHRQQVEDELASHDVPLRAVEQARDFYDDLLGWFDDRIATYLDAEFGREWRTGQLDVLPDHDIEVPLRDPEAVERDELTAWAESAGYTGDLWRSLSTVGVAVEQVIDELGLARTPVCTAVGAVMSQWWECDHATYLREVELEYAPKDKRSVSEPWEAQYTAGLVLFECMPGETLQEIFDGLGGGILMSATLEPLDVFAEVAGLESLRAANRPVVERTYTLPFPESNRASLLVDTTPFTARNRGDPDENASPETWNRTRDEYAQVLRALARSPGNVLLAMPNYREAAWAEGYLSEVVEKPTLLDESSSNEETEALKQRFFDGDGKVLVTSTRGTLTEGVDYDGDKLHCCGVFGIPLVNIGSPRVTAVRRAYADAFGEDQAFEYALTVPAVRRARQTIGRVIRGTDEVGIRALVGQRYVDDARHSVFPYLSTGEQAEFVRLTPEFLDGQIHQFWDEHGNPE
ncbi:DNA excision repair protein ERCC-2 [Halovenus aranensis]|uniref:DNA excision repair protein ERCC-2 n=1 Tax=Halovenus aranensis TaxID=890420 RepID=A0A1G8WQ59_9EURY|nr:ATP-dependent DNA helicase [Halovenus aranensis]SDJ80187.1 DNA excision repair protein ERCC-2 [Halovenus aranensis]